MKILREGTPATAIVTCQHCSCQMEYTNKDMRIDYDSSNNQITHIVKRNLYIECPCCGEHIVVNKL